MEVLSWKNVHDRASWISGYSAMDDVNVHICR